MTAQQLAAAKWVAMWQALIGEEELEVMIADHTWRKANSDPANCVEYDEELAEARTDYADVWN